MEVLVTGQGRWLRKWLRVPASVAEQSLSGVRRRLDHLNAALANRALPEERRERVSELALEGKAVRAGQKKPSLKAVEKQQKSSNS